MTQSRINEAASSPILGELLEKKALPDGGWRATGAEEKCLYVTFENENLARNFAMRCAEKGYSATTPLSTVGGYWNVKVENMKNNNIEDKFYNQKRVFGNLPDLQSVEHNLALCQKFDRELTEHNLNISKLNNELRNLHDSFQMIRDNMRAGKPNDADKSSFIGLNKVLNSFVQTMARLNTRKS